MFAYPTSALQGDVLLTLEIMDDLFCSEVVQCTMLMEKMRPAADGGVVEVHAPFDRCVYTHTFVDGVCCSG